MKFLEFNPLSLLSDYGISIEIIIIVGLALIVLIALIGFTVNYRTQMKVSLNMDTECNIYNRKGLEIFIKKHRKKISNPTLLLVEIKNLEYLYKNYPNKIKLMFEISTLFLKGESKKETLARVEFNKFIILYENRSKEEIKEKTKQLEETLNSTDFENYGLYNFRLIYSIYEGPEFKNISLDITKILFIKQFSNVYEDNIYYYCDEVGSKIDLFYQMNAQKLSAYEQKQFVPYVQPKVDLRSGKVVGGEVLVRWVDANQNTIYSPADFIVLFESNGFVKEVEFLMLEAACELAQRMVQRGKSDINISINFSQLTLISRDFIPRLSEIASKYPTVVKNIEIEIYEAIIMKDYNYISNIIAQIHQRGFQVSMDGFGRDLSSLGSLTHMPLDAIKMDNIFFRERLSTEKTKYVAQNILRMLYKLEYPIVCVGVEDKATLDVLATYCRDFTIQGYCVSMPLPVPEFETFADRIFNFECPPFVEEGIVVSNGNIKVTTDGNNANGGNGAGGNGGTSINISGISSQNSEIEAMRRQMEEMQKYFQKELEEQRKASHEREMKQMQEHMELLQKMQNGNKQPERDARDAEIEMLKREIEMISRNQQNPQLRGTQDSEIEMLRHEIELLHRYNQSPNQTRDARDTEIEMLKREIEMLRYNDRDRGRDRYFIREDNPSNSKIDELQKQIEELKNMQKSQIDVDDLIAKIAKTQSNAAQSEIDKAKNEAKSLRETLERERKEKEELEALLTDLQNKDDLEIDEEEIKKEIEEADKNFVLNIDDLSDDDKDDEDDDEEDDEEDSTEVLEKPKYSLEELEAIIAEFKRKYEQDWNRKAKEELKDGYYEVVNGLKYYRGKIKLDFAKRMLNANSEVKNLYNIAKNELMQYSGVVNKTLTNYDVFYIGKKQIAKLSLTKRRIRVYLALDSSQYSVRQFPHKNVSDKKAHVRTPFFMMIKSRLSVRRMQSLIGDVMLDCKSKLNESYKPVDYVAKLKLIKGNK